MIAIGENEFRELTYYMQSNYGLNLSKKRNLIEGRLSNVITEKGFDDFKQYLDYVFSDKTGREEAVLVNRLTTNHTYFMREPEHFQYYRKYVLPYIVDTAKEMDLRVWSAGCSSGEEPYTLAMINQDFFEGRNSLWDTKILATDISSKVLKKAKSGIYSSESIKSIPNVWKAEYFTSIGDGNFKISDSIRNEVIFRVLNLMDDVFPFKRKFHAIFCRNVMIYFDQDTKDELVHKFYEITEDGGYLFIGHSESIGRDSSGYKYIMPAVYRKE